MIHLVGSKRFHAASKHGLPFVAWTRSQNFAMIAFKNLPAWQDFVKGRHASNAARSHGKAFKNASAYLVKVFAIQNSPAGAACA